jgi:hypothetical protein
MEELVKANPALLTKICIVLDQLKISDFFKDNSDPNIIAKSIRNHLKPVMDGNFHTCSECDSIFSLEYKDYKYSELGYKYGQECNRCEKIYCNNCANFIECFSCGDKYCDKCVTHECAFCDKLCCSNCYKFDRNRDTYSCVNHPEFISCHDCGHNYNLCKKHCADCIRLDTCDSINCAGDLCSICDVHLQHDTCGKKFCGDCFYEHKENKCILCKKICCDSKYCSKECIETARNLLLVEESKFILLPPKN